MRDERLEQRIKMFNSEGKINLLESTENYHLSLRKRKLDMMLMSKRIINYQSTNSYEIEISTLDISQEYKDYMKTYIDQIKTKQFEVKFIWEFLFSQDISKLKYALYLLCRFISIQLDSSSDKDNQSFFLSRNDFALVNLICSLLKINDNQIKYASLWCLLNLTLFPSKIEERIYIKDNLNHIYQAFKESDFILMPIVVDLIRNCCVSKKENALYFIKQNILSSFSLVLQHKDTNEELEIKILYCVSILSKAINENIELLKEFYEIIPLLKPLFIQIKTNEKCFHFVYILLTNITLNTDLFDVLITPDLISTLFELFNNKQNKQRFKVIRLIITFLSGSDSSTQILINYGVLDILKSGLVDYNKDKDILTDVLWGIANLFGGTLGQCEQAEASGILVDLLNIGKTIFEELKSQHCEENNKGLFKELLYAMGNISTGGSIQTKINLLEFENGLVLKMIVFGLTQYENMKDMIQILLSALREYIILEENMMVERNITQILLNENIEEVLKHLYGKETNERNIELIDILLSTFNEL